MENMRVQNDENFALKDIRDVKINTSLCKKERKKSFEAQIENPRLFKCGDVTVRISFIKTDVTLEDRLINHFKSLI